MYDVKMLFRSLSLQELGFRFDSYSHFEQIAENEKKLDENAILTLLMIKEIFWCRCRSSVFFNCGRQLSISIEV
jgi:hypothetical protein